MSESKQTQTERYYRAYQRGAMTGLLFVLAAAGLLLAVLVGALGTGAARGSVLLIFALFFVTLFAVHFTTLRGRLWRPGAPQEQLVLRDEWTRQNWNRACRTAFFVTMWAQLPLGWFVSRIAPTAHVSSMAGLTMALGAASFFASYLYRSSREVNG